VANIGIERSHLLYTWLPQKGASSLFRHVVVAFGEGKVWTSEMLEKACCAEDDAGFAITGPECVEKTSKNGMPTYV
jgi:hypothetical protein